MNEEEEEEKEEEEQARSFLLIRGTQLIPTAAEAGEHLDYLYDDR